MGATMIKYLYEEDGEIVAYTEKKCDKECLSIYRWNEIISNAFMSGEGIDKAIEESNQGKFIMLKEGLYRQEDDEFYSSYTKVELNII